MRGGGGLPSGTVTFLFTDIERSTASIAALGDEGFADVQDAHRQLLRDAFGVRGGVEIRTEGDALFVVFERALDATAAAIEGQLALRNHEWPSGVSLRVRMGIHTGEAYVRHRDYVGHDVNKAKRVCDAGHGGQVLLSETTASLVDEHLEEATFLIDLGRHRLKDLGEPQRLHQLAAPGLETEFPPLLTLDAFTNNLPPQRSSFIGRETEIAEIRKLLDRHRMVTLAGIGGTGKTRLALQVGAEELDRFPDGVFLVELATLSEPSLVSRTVADAVGMIIGGSLTGGTSTPVEELVVSYLGRKVCMLVLDNCEHLLDACAELVDTVLAACPNVAILATSRESLQVEGEQIWRVPSLSLPASAADAGSSEAVGLFAARAKAVQPHFELTTENTTPVVEICERLDGLPLAIELAASRVAHLSPAQIASRLDDMFRLLTGGRRRVQRQQTLEASLNWSHELLDEPERVLLRRLAVFSGTFALDAAEDICTNGDIDRRSIIDLLRSLVAKSLLSANDKASEVRYRLLEPVRLYAAEHLRDAGEAETFRERHHDRYLAWVESFPSDEATFGFRALRAFESEHDNLRSAIEWSSAHKRYENVARMANGLLTLWWNGGHYDEGFHWLTTVIDHADGIDKKRLAESYASLTACSVMRVDGRTAEYAARTVDVGVDSPGPASIAIGLDAISSVVRAETMRDPKLIAQTLDQARVAVQSGALAGPAWQAFALVAAGQVHLVVRDIAGAARALAEAFDLWQLPSVSSVASSSALASARHVLGDSEAAIEAARIAADVEEEWWQPGMGANALGLALAGVGDFGEAKRRLATSIRNARSWGVDLWVNEVLIFCGAVAFLAGDAARASRLLAAGRHLGGARQMTTPFRTGQSYAIYLHYIPLIRDALGARDAHRTRVEARAMTLDEAVAYALEGLEERSSP